LCYLLFAVVNYTVTTIFCVVEIVCFYQEGNNKLIGTSVFRK